MDVEGLTSSSSFPPSPDQASYHSPEPRNLVLELGVACVLNDRDRVIQLLNMGAEPKAANEEGKSALDIANSMNRIDIIKCLFRDMDVPEVGLVELLRAIRSGKAAIVQALLEMGVGYQMEGEIIYPGVFMLACAIGTISTVETLYHHGPHINVKAFKDALINVSTYCERPEIADLIIEIVTQEWSSPNNQVQEETAEDPIAEFLNDPSPDELTLEVLFE